MALPPLTDHLTKHTQFNWSQKCQSVFNDLKAAVLETTSLQFFDPNQPIAVFTDASHIAMAAILMQLDQAGGGNWRPIEYRSRKFTGGGGS